MTISEILSAVLNIEGAEMGRQNKSNFVVIPTNDGFAKVEIKTALAKDTKAHAAFNKEAAVANYKAWEAEAALKAAERANKPVKVKGPNPEAQARRDEMDAKIAALPSFVEYTATDIHKALGYTMEDKVLPMHVGASAKRLVEKGVLVTTTREGDKKTYYTKA